MFCLYSNCGLNIYINMYIHIYIYICMYMYIYIYIYTGWPKKKYYCLIKRKMKNKRGIFKSQIVLNYQ